MLTRIMFYHMQGYNQFAEAIRSSFNLPADSELSITFSCDEPSTGAGLLSEPVNFQGASF